MANTINELDKKSATSVPVASPLSEKIKAAKEALALVQKINSRQKQNNG
jgi:hypothetical protein